MNKIIINNGFHNHGQEGILLTGVLVSGKVKINDILILTDTNRISIIDVEFDNKTFPGTTHVRLLVSNEYSIEWYKLYGKEYEIESIESC